MWRPAPAWSWALWLLVRLPDVVTSAQWRRLAAAIEAEVPRLGFTWTAFAAHARMGKRTIYDLRQGIRTSYDDSTISRLESALSWQHGSVDRVLKGQDPQRIPDPLLARLQHVWPTLTDEAKAMIVDLAERSSQR